MSKGDWISKWLARLFVLVCMFFVSLGGVILLVGFEIMSASQSLMLVLPVMIGVFFFQRQNEIIRDINLLKSRSDLLDQYTSGLQRTLDDLNDPVLTSRTDHGGTEDAPGTPDNPLVLNPVSNLAVSHVAESNPVKPQIADNLVDQVEDEESLADRADASASSSPAAKIGPDEGRISDNSLKLHLRPVVELPTRKPLYYDAFMRLDTGDGSYLEETEFNQRIKTKDLQPMVDKPILLAAIRMIRNLVLLKTPAGIFCPLSAATLRNTRIFNALLTDLKENESVIGSMVIEIRQREFAGLDQEQTDRLAELAELDIALSLTDVQDIAINPCELFASGFRFVKVPASILLHADTDTMAQGAQPTTLAADLDAAGIQLVATQVERDREIANLTELNVLLAQGNLFAPPRPVNAKLLTHNT
jgi:cyclic-di-GMP phosphodiesterase TipF (flagellum assembly factor)